MSKKQKLFKAFGIVCLGAMAVDAILDIVDLLKSNGGCDGCMGCCMDYGDGEDDGPACPVDGDDACKGPFGSRTDSGKRAASADPDDADEGGYDPEDEDEAKTGGAPEPASDCGGCKGCEECRKYGSSGSEGMTEAMGSDESEPAADPAE